MRWLVRLRQLLCEHEARVEDIESFEVDGNRAVFVKCEKCGKMLKAPYGLALPVRWL